MAMTIQNAILFSSVLLIMALTNACGGGGNSGPIGDGGGDNPPSSDILNPDISGHLFFEKSGRAWRMDMATGKYTVIPNTNWRDQDQRYPLAGGVAEFYAYPVDYDDSEFVVEARDCKRSYNDVLAPKLTCIAMQDMNGNYLGQFDVFYDVTSSSIEMSRDHQYLALFRRVGQSVSSDQWFEIYDRNGTLISDKKLEPRSFAWLPDGRLVYTRDRSFYFTKAPDANGKPTTDVDIRMTLPDNLQGWPGQIAVSPDGTQLAFSLITRIVTAVSMDSTPYIMNIDGTGLRQLATTPNIDIIESMINSPKWSPDGRWILVREGNFSNSGGGGGQLGGSPGKFYLLPTEDMGKVFMLSNTNSIRSPEVRRLRRHKNISTIPSAIWITDASSDIAGGSWQP